MDFLVQTSCVSSDLLKEIMRDYLSGKKQKSGSKTNPNKPHTQHSRITVSKPSTVSTSKEEASKSKVVFVPKNKVGANAKTESGPNKYWGRNR